MYITSGSRVIATTKIEYGTFSSVPKGTIGVVVSVDTGIIFATTYNVKFNGVEKLVACKEAQIAAI
jgi:hypothetical protein